ncbi:MAG: SOS response-associated peptidase [Pseudomonadota bacterium]
MCGRFALAVEPEALLRFIGLTQLLSVPPRFNIAPTQPVLAVFEEAGRRVGRELRWGFAVPGVRAPLINARSETLFDKPAFREAVRSRRCLVPASGFYEWERGGAKRPWLFRPAEGGIMAIAALWQPEAPGGAPTALTLVTTRANATVAPLHERMPVLVPPSGFEAWLDPEADIAPLLGPAPDGALTALPLDGTVSDARTEGPACWNPRVERQGRLF